MSGNEEKEELHQIDDLEHKLYDPKEKYEDTSFHHIHERNSSDIPRAWTDATPIITPARDGNKGLSFGTKVLFVALGILCITLLFTAWRVLSSRNVVSESNIDVILDSKPYVEGGEATPFTVSVVNRNTVPLQNASLTLSYEKGVGVQDEQEKIYEKRDLGILTPNTLKKEDMSITLYGAESDTRVISVKLEYKVGGANATFNKTVTTQVVLKTPPLSVHVNGPSQLVQGQEGVFTISVRNNTTEPITNSLVIAALPTTFTLRSSDPKSNTRGTTWNLASVLPGATSTITMYGSFSGEPGESDTIKAIVGSASQSINQIGVVYSQEAHPVSISAPLLSFGVRLETDRGAAENLRYGDKAVVTISYKNKSDKPLSDVSVIATIAGDAAVLAGISADNGYYDSINKKVTWSGATNNELRTLAPGSSGDLKIYIPVVSKGTNAPKLVISLNGAATVTSKDDTKTALSKTWTVEGSATFTALSQFKNGSFANTGPLPPKANQDTSYASHLVVSAQNALVNAKVSFILPAYVTFSGVYGKGTNVTYDTRTRTVVWNIGSVAGGAVVTNDIQLVVRPSQSHVGQTPAITSGVTLEADEADSKAHIRMVTSQLTIELKEQGVLDISHVIAN